MSLESIIDVNIVVSSSALTRVGFGTPIGVAYHTLWPETVRTFGSLTELNTAVTNGGGDTNHPVYKMGVAVTSSNPGVSTFKIGKREAGNLNAMSGRLTPTVLTENAVVSCVVVSPDGTQTTLSHTNAAFETVAAIVTDLTAQLTAITGISASDQTTHVEFTADNAGEIFYFRNFTSGLEILHTTTDNGIATDLAAILMADPDWYGFSLDTFAESELDAAATWAESNNKLHGATTQDHQATDPAVMADILSVFQSKAYHYSFGLYNSTAEAYGAFAWIGHMFPKDSGDATWAYKTLPGVQADNLTTEQQGAVLAKNGNIYYTVAGRNITRNGTAGSGRFMDITRGVDELGQRIAEDLFAFISSQEKVNYTDAGISAIDGVLQGTLLGFTVPRRNFLASFVTSVPAEADVSPTDKSNRLLPDVSFTATGAGAIHQVVVNGTVSF